MSSNGVERPPASAPGLMRCARCDCTFKRSEHLKRHERIHDTHKRFACSTCQKLFTRSDILRRHEATHVAIEQTNGDKPLKTRACTECARSRERCTKSDPCQRCQLKGLRCTYPQPRASMRQQSTPFDQGSIYRPNGSAFPQELSQASPGLSRESMTVMSTGAAGHNADHHPGAPLADYASYPTPERSMMPYNLPQAMVPDYQHQQLLQPSIEFPMNWLPPDESLTIDYDSIVGLGVSSLDFFSLPETPNAVLNLSNVQNERNVHAGPIAATFRAASLTERNTDAHVRQQQSGIWSSASPTTLERYTSSQSPHSIAQTLSPSAAPGGLYATSGTGARMPCTIRARRSSRLVPGGSGIPMVTDERCGFHDKNEAIAFPDTSHLLIDQVASPVFDAYTGLSQTVYDKIREQFDKLCLSEISSFPAYSNSVFPSISTLSTFITLYFENFDVVIPILHEEVTRVHDHWLLALAVASIGCHYAEADEFSRSVEPMHEFLRRAIKIEVNGRSSHGIGADVGDIALAQAMTLNHIGMLYCGSPRMLRFARSQHSTLVDMARSIAFSLLTSPAKMDPFNSIEYGGEDLIWHNSIVEECKRRIGYTIWMIDCMAAYQFSQQPSMPPDLVPVPLPDDRLWSTNSPGELAARPPSLQETPSLQSAINSLFREKSLNPELGQFSRIILLHGVYREVFYIKDCLDGPLGGWVPSLQQTTAPQRPQSPSTRSSGGHELLSSRRNAALDCLDVLHWAANATIAQAAGAEHPTVLHLHLARTVILSPLTQIRTFAESIVSFTKNPPTKTLDAARRRQIVDIERDILEWAQRDQCKARLAVLHSGCLFWHIRRYSIRAFHEPLAVFLATLTLWAFSSYASRSTGAPSSPHRHITHGSSAVDVEMSQHIETPSDQAVDDIDSAPDFIHLDRPNDDEMVQFFVRNGSAARMRANITGVGDIYATTGPAKILKEGLKILSAVSTAWGRTNVYADTLQVLEQVASGRSET